MIMLPMLFVVLARDAYNIPTGRVPAIAAGVLLAEIQQTSDIACRIYDYDRVDKVTGEKRALHNDLALDVIDFNVEKNDKTNYDLHENECNELIHTPYLKSNVFNVTKILSRNYTLLDSFMIFICTKGNLDIVVSKESYNLTKGETILLPASIKSVHIIPNIDSEILEVS